MLAAHHLQTVVHCKEQVEFLEQTKLDKPLTVWLKIDTGMHRLGVRQQEFEQIVKQTRPERQINSNVMPR